MLERCDYHACPGCDCDVVHIIQDGICCEGHWLLCDACFADPQPDHTRGLLPQVCGCGGKSPSNLSTCQWCGQPFRPVVDEWTRQRNAPIQSDPARPLDYHATFERALRGRD